MSEKTGADLNSVSYQVPESGAEFYFKVKGENLKIDRAQATVAEILQMAGFTDRLHTLVRLSKDHPGQHEHLRAGNIVNFLQYGIEEFDVEIKKVEVSINGAIVEVIPGEHRVLELKRELHVPAAHILASLVHQQLKPLDDASTVCIEGGEKFISYPCDGQAS